MTQHSIIAQKDNHISTKFLPLSSSCHTDTILQQQFYKSQHKDHGDISQDNDETRNSTSYCKFRHTEAHQHRMACHHTLSCRMDNSSSPDRGTRRIPRHDNLSRRHACHTPVTSCKPHHIENPYHNTLSPPPPSHSDTYKLQFPYRAGTCPRDTSPCMNAPRNPVTSRISSHKRSTCGCSGGHHASSRKSKQPRPTADN